ncbi:hypothetical protein TgHK011_001152 [Trichoderma gracile]|nr:hypothetical protein TgHK011_001152 [Trichoderma gracile]
MQLAGAADLGHELDELGTGLLIRASSASPDRTMDALMQFSLSHGSALDEVNRGLVGYVAGIEKGFRWKWRWRAAGIFLPMRHPPAFILLLAKGSQGAG